MSERVACLRCGDFAEVAALPLRGLELCARCFAGESTSPFPTTSPSKPRSKLTPRRAGIALGLALVGAIPAGWGAFAIATILEGNLGAARDPLSELVWTAAGALVGALALGGLGLLATSEPKRQLLETLGLAHAGERFLECAFLEKSASFLTGWPALEWGLLAITPQGLGFLGAQGTRCVLHVSDMKAVRAAWDWRVTGSWCLEVEHASGVTKSIAFLRKGTVTELASLYSLLIATRAT